MHAIVRKKAFDREELNRASDTLAEFHRRDGYRVSIDPHA